MKKIGFIGAYDKTDLILNIAKILTMFNKQVLVVDSTICQKAKYIVPAINPTKTYITEFEKIDVAIGFYDEEEIMKYLAISDEKKIEYDIMLVDTDNVEGYKNFKLDEAFKKYFVTSFDNYSLKKGLETLSGLQDVTSLTKVLFEKDIIKEEEDYLDFLASNYKIAWKEEKFYFPIENGDLSAIYENQRVGKIKFKKLSAQYKDGITYISEQILEDEKESAIRREIRKIEKGEWQCQL